jgi:hypothetical protein
MTVGELREKLKSIDPTIPVVISLDAGNESGWYDISDISLHRGTPTRVDGAAGFTFDVKGAVTWLFIDVTED